MSKTVSKKSTQSSTTKKAKVEATTTAPAVAPVPVAPTPVAVAPVVAPVKEVKAGEVQEGGKRKRFFKCVYEGKVHGRYSGDKPKQAANKAFTNIIRTLPEGGVGKKVKFQMKECTRGSNQKTSTYEGERVKLDTPLKIEIKKNTDKPKIIEYKFTNKINKVTEAVQTGGEKKKTTKPKKVVKSAKSGKTAKNTQKVSKKTQKTSKAKSTKAETKPVEVPKTE